MLKRCSNQHKMLFHNFATPTYYYFMVHVPRRNAHHSFLFGDPLKQYYKEEAGILFQRNNKEDHFGQSFLVHDKDTVLLVCLLGWLGSHWKHVVKYTDWYAQECNLPCLALIPTMTTPYEKNLIHLPCYSLANSFAQSQAQSYVNRLHKAIDEIQQKHPQKRVKTVWHVLSGNGLNMYGHIVKEFENPQVCYNFVLIYFFPEHQTKGHGIMWNCG